MLKWHPWLYFLNLITPFTEEDKRGLARTAWWNGDGTLVFSADCRCTSFVIGP